MTGNFSRLEAESRLYQLKDLVHSIWMAMGSDTIDKQDGDAVRAVCECVKNELNYFEDCLTNVVRGEKAEASQ